MHHFRFHSVFVVSSFLFLVCAALRWRSTSLQLFALSRTGWRVFPTFRPPPVGVRLLAKTGLQTNCFSPSSSPRRRLEFSSWRMWGCFVQVWCVVCAVARCRGAFMRLWRTVSDGDVGGKHLLPGATFRRLSGTVLGSRGVTSIPWRFFSSRTTSCVPYLPTVSNWNIISVKKPSLTGPSSAGRLYWNTLRAALRKSVALTRLEIDESKFGRRSFRRGHAVKGQWVFGGVEHESGRTFLVPVPDRTADTSMAVSDWIEPGTTVISDCWAAYRDLGAHGYTYRTVNHTIGFVDERTVGSRSLILREGHGLKVCYLYIYIFLYLYLYLEHAHTFRIQQRTVISF